MLYYSTVTDPLKDSLIALMSSPVFEPFRLVGGTALSLQIGHRVSVDIDLFTDAPYGSIDFEKIDDKRPVNFHEAVFIHLLFQVFKAVIRYIFFVARNKLYIVAHAFDE